MRFNKLNAKVKKAAFAATGLLLGVGVAAAQQTINLSAGPTTAIMPDGSTVPMWATAAAPPRQAPLRRARHRTPARRQAGPAL